MNTSTAENFYLEKLVFLEMTNKELTILPTPEYLETFKRLTESEKSHFGLISKQIHLIWNHINVDSIPNMHTKIADTIDEYNDKVENIDPLILKCHHDYGITLKRTMNEKFKAAIIKFFDKDFFDNHFNS